MKNYPCSSESICGYKFPDSAKFGRVVPKNKIYEHGSLSSAVKQLFVQQVEQIVWQHKLAPETVNLKASKAVPEIQVFSIALKGGELKTEVLRCIDQAIPFPILFELRYDEKIMSIAAYKRPSESDSGKWVISEYFYSDWVNAFPLEREPQIDTDAHRLDEKNISVYPCSSVVEKIPLPVVMDLGQLYERLLDGLMPYPARPGENLQKRVARMESIRLKQRELDLCEARLRKEKQFNRKVAINAALRNLKQELEGLVS